MKQAIQFSLSFVLCLIASTGCSQPAESAHEAPPVLDAATILRPEYFSEVHHRVRPQVPAYTGHNQFVIDSDFGTFEATGNRLLAERVAEIYAIAALREISKTEEYGQALKAAANAPVQLAQNLVTDPVHTITGVPKGIWKFMNRTGQAIKEGGSGQSRNPYEDSGFEGMIGFSKVKRDLAAQLRVDPYSSNEVLQRELNSVAWASYGGKMTFGAALLPLGGTLGSLATGVQVSGVSIEALTDLSPTDLRIRNLDILLGMGVSRADAEAFLANPVFSPSRSTLLVDALERMKGVAGRDVYLRFAMAADDEVDAVFFQFSAEALAAMHAVAPLAQMDIFHEFPVALARDGSLVLGLDWDYAAWTPQVEIFLRELFAAAGASRRITGFSVGITGVASPLVEQRFESLGYRLYEQVVPGPLMP